MKTVKKVDYADILARGMRDVEDYRSGKVSMPSEQVTVPLINPKEIRRELEISQQEFADRFGIPISSIRNWEQERRIPDQPTNTLLHLIKEFPDLVAAEVRKLRAH